MSANIRESVVNVSSHPAVGECRVTLLDQDGFSDLRVRHQEGGGPSFKQPVEQQIHGTLRPTVANLDPC